MQLTHAAQPDMFPGPNGRGDVGDLQLKPAEKQVKAELEKLLNITGSFLPYEALMKIREEFPLIADAARRHLSQNRRNDH